MGRYKLSSKMRELVLSLLLLPTLAMSQCANEMPSGRCCEADGFFAEADPEACSFYYDCVEGTISHKQCEPLSADGLPRVFDEVFDWCAYREDVDCGSRPCNDPAMCATQPPKTTPTTTADCGTVADCKELGDGYFPDPYNCRKYWHCYKGEGEHIICPDDPATGEPEVYDLVFNGCNFQELTDCGERPICDECDNNCQAGHTTTPDCGHFMDCADKEDGWYADDFNCRKYWHCSGGHGSHLMCDDKDGDHLLYNADKVQCDFPNRVDCGERQVCDECDNNCHENECEDCGGDADCGPPDHHPDDICVGRNDGWYPDLFNCAKYWHCSAEKGTHFLCASGLVYESNKVQCDWPDRVDCGSRPTCDQCDENCQ